MTCQKGRKGDLILKFKPHKDFVNPAFSERFGSLSIYDGNGSENVTSEFALIQTSSLLFHLVQVDNIGEFFCC